VCGVLALVIAIVFAVRFGTFVARNTSVFTAFDNCIARAGDRSAVSSCIAASRTTSGHRGHLGIARLLASVDPRGSLRSSRC
jgi:hypothetical protein